jgi:hypothetical protein
VALTKKRRQLHQSKEGLSHQLMINMIQLNNKKQIQFKDEAFQDNHDFDAMNAYEL